MPLSMTRTCVKTTAAGKSRCCSNGWDCCKHKATFAGVKRNEIWLHFTSLNSVKRRKEISHESETLATHVACGNLVRRGRAGRAEGPAVQGADVRRHRDHAASAGRQGASTVPCCANAGVWCHAGHGRRRHRL